MSYSANVKTEIMANTPPESDCCALAEAAAMFALCGSVMLGRGAFALRFSNEHAAVARRAYVLIKRLTGAKAELSAHEHARLKQKNLYQVDVPGPEASSLFLKKARVMDGEGGINRSVPQGLLVSDCCKRAYLRGAFLASGTLTSPEKSYQLAIYVGEQETADSLCEFLKGLSLKANTGKRRENYVVYIKESDSIVDFLSLAGASSAVFQMENTRILKDIHNNVNRAMNCEAANFEKSHSAATAQIEDIRYIIDCGEFTRLPKALRETAEVRLEYPEATLTDLGELLVPAKSKSCVNHRLAKLRTIAGQLRDFREEQL